jgi:hypothetical protein
MRVHSLLPRERLGSLRFEGDPGRNDKTHEKNERRDEKCREYAQMLEFRLQPALLSGQSVNSFGEVAWPVGSAFSASSHHDDKEH